MVWYKPWSKGSGIPETKCVLNGVSIPQVSKSSGDWVVDGRWGYHAKARLEPGIKEVSVTLRAVSWVDLTAIKMYPWFLLLSWLLQLGGVKKTTNCLILYQHKTQV